MKTTIRIFYSRPVVQLISKVTEYVMWIGLTSGFVTGTILLFNNQ